MSIGALMVTAAFRLSYPFPLESAEQASIEQVRRVLEGQSLYVAPTLQHVPFIYGPVYYYASALASLALGFGYLPLRAVSVLASLGTLGLVAVLIGRETDRLSPGLVAAGLLAATYPISGIFDVGHVDALFIFFLMASITLARLRPDTLGLVASGAFVGLAGLTKVPIGAAPVAAALALYLLLTIPSRLWAFVIGCAATLAIGVVALHAQAGEWATWYLFTLPSAHVINNHGDSLGRFWFSDVLPRLTFPLLIGPLFLLACMTAGDRRPMVFYGLACLSLIGVGWAARSNSGGAPNVLAPAFLALGLLFGLGFSALRSLLGNRKSHIGVLWAYALGLFVLQFLVLAYNPRLLVPYRSEQWAADRLSSTLTGLDGQLFAPNLGGYVHTSDNGEQPYIGAVLEITGSYGGAGTSEGDKWKQDLRAALERRQFSHVVLIEDCCDMTAALSETGYVLAGPLFAPDDDYWLWTGNRTPSTLMVYVPAEAAH